MYGGSAGDERDGNGLQRGDLCVDGEVREPTGLGRVVRGVWLLSTDDYLGGILAGHTVHLSPPSTEEI